MGYAITLFMWGYQPYYRRNLESRAKEVLQSIAPTLEPKVFLVGIRAGDDPEAHPVCVEPENGVWDPTLCFDCYARTKEIFEGHPDHQIIYGDEPSMRDLPENIRRKSVRQAVREVVAAYDQEHKTMSFCGTPGLVAAHTGR